MRVMVTGGTGFIGSYVVRQLVEDGHRVTILARNPAKVAGLIGQPNIDFVEGSITSTEAIATALRGQNACVHVALGRGETSAASWAEADTVPALRIFEAAADAGVEHLIHTSSIAVFDGYGGTFDDDLAVSPTRYYGATKAAVEAYLIAIAAVRSVRAIVIRPGYTFGNPVVEGASTQNMPELPGIVAKALRNEPISVVGNSALQFTWAGDLARVYSAALSSSVAGGCFTAVSANTVTWEQVARWAVEIVGSASEVVVEDRGRPAATAGNDVSGIEREFGLRFDSESRLKDHLRYLAGLPA